MFNTRELHMKLTLNMLLLGGSDHAYLYKKTICKALEAPKKASSALCRWLFSLLCHSISQKW